MIFYRAMRPVKALSFDLDDTLYDNRPVIARLEHAMLEWLASEHPATVGLDWGALRHEMRRTHPELKSDVSVLRYRQLVEGFVRSGYALSQATQSAEQGMQVAHYWRNQVEVPEQTHQVMRALAAHFPLVAVTNGNVDVNQIGLKGYFQHVFKAGEHGEAKPAGDLFELASQQLAIEKAHILHVGDHLRSDVHGANQHGLMSCWYNPNGDNLRHAVNVMSLPTWEIRQLPQLLALL